MTDRDVHEIPLSGKQLVFLFMAAVVLLVIVFLLGVSVGRGVGQAPVEATDTSVPVEVPPTAAEPADMGFHSELTGPEGQATLRPAPPPTPPPESVEPPPSQAAPPPTATAEDAWWVQVGAYGKANADAVVDRLKGLGYTPVTSPLGSIFRVRLGPFADRAEAARLVASLEREGFTPQITR